MTGLSGRRLAYLVVTGVLFIAASVGAILFLLADSPLTLVCSAAAILVLLVFRFVSRDWYEEDA